MRLLTALLVAAALAPAADASTWIADNARTAALKVDARGYAEVDWIDASGRHSMLVPPRGRLLPGGHIAGRDISRPSVAAVPFARVVRRTPDGRLWALQAWAVDPDGPGRVASRALARRPDADHCDGEGSHLVGSVTFGGKAVSGTSSSPEGKRIRITAYVDALAVGGWRRLVGVAPRLDGGFRLFLRPAWQESSYRVTVVGPNRGAQLAPDARTLAVSR